MKLSELTIDQINTLITATERRARSDFYRDREELLKAIALVQPEYSRRLMETVLKGLEEQGPVPPSTDTRYRELVAERDRRGSEVNSEPVPPWWMEK